MKRTPSRQITFLHFLEHCIDQDVIVAFSGGVDSTLLLKASQEIGNRKNHTIHAVTFKTSLHPSGDIECAKQQAREIGVDHRVLDLDEMKDANIQHNPVNRCYLCKRFLFGQLRKLADELGITKILDGTNGDDLQAYRPGLRALQELRIISPLAEAGMTKADIRRMAAGYGLISSDRPSAPCLATRFPYGTKLTSDMMNRVETGEEYLRKLGFYNVRIRVHGNIARIELDNRDFAKAIDSRRQIVGRLKEIGYTYITLDLEGFRSGSMDVGIKPET